MMVLPVIFVLFRALQLDRRYVGIFFSCLLVMSNTGGASSPIGDFPAVIIMTSGITTFTDYLFRAFPVFLLTSVLVAAVWRTAVKRLAAERHPARWLWEFLQSRYKYTKVRRYADRSGCHLSRDVSRLELCAAGNRSSGSHSAARLRDGRCSRSKEKGIDVKQIIDMKSVLTIASFLFLAAVVSASGYLSTAAQYLQSVIGDQKILPACSHADDIRHLRPVFRRSGSRGYDADHRGSVQHLLRSPDTLGGSGLRGIYLRRFFHVFMVGDRRFYSLGKDRRGTAGGERNGKNLSVENTRII